MALLLNVSAWTCLLSAAARLSHEILIIGASPRTTRFGILVYFRRVEIHSPTPDKMTAKRDRIVKLIAWEYLQLETLETRNTDSDDFSDQAVWSIAAALEAAYEAGRKNG